MPGDIEYRVIFSGRRSISLIVSPDKGVTIRAPYGTSLKSIERFVQEKSAWIKKHLEKHSELTRVNQGKKYDNGELHLYLGKEQQLRITESEQLFVRISDGIIEIGTDNTSDKMKIKALLDTFYLRQARTYLAVRFKEISESLISRGFYPSGFSVKTLKSRWGSCSFHGRITISSELIKLDPVFADYVIIHELCHLKNHNHGKDFYRLLGELVPDFKSIRKELRKYLTR